jgi:hypothetical protein
MLLEVLLSALDASQSAVMSLRHHGPIPAGLLTVATIGISRTSSIYNRCLTI